MVPLQHFVMLFTVHFAQASPWISVWLNVCDQEDQVRYIHKLKQQVLSTNNACYEMQQKDYY